MKNLLIIALASTLLTGCAGTSWDTTAGGTPITIGGINQALAQTAQATQQMSQDSIAIMQQASKYQITEVKSVRQPDGTTWVYCRGVTDTLYHCRTY